jgi:hypothetical protein
MWELCIEDGFPFFFLRQLLIAAEVLTCIGIAMSFNYGFITYSVSQYVSASLILFVSAEVLEGM